MEHLVNYRTISSKYNEYMMLYTWFRCSKKDITYLQNTSDIEGLCAIALQQLAAKCEMDLQNQLLRGS